MGDPSTTFHFPWNIYFQKAAYNKVAIELRNKTNFWMVLGLLHSHWNIAGIIEQLHIVYLDNKICWPWCMEYCVVYIEVVIETDVASNKTKVG